MIDTCPHCGVIDPPHLAKCPNDDGSVIAFSLKRREGPRSVEEIAKEIYFVWKKPYFGAVPYLNAMRWGDYGADGLESVVLYFLSNATTFRGEAARRLKAELKAAAGVK
jgi:hypothetical protein